MSNYFSFQRFLERIPQILPYALTTLNMVAVIMTLGTLLAIIVAAIRIRKIPVINQLLSVYISFMRGTPLLVQMCVAYYGIPIIFSGIFNALFGINLNRIEPLIFVEIAFILNEGAFLGEIFRSAILSVPPIQTEAGYSIGMTRFQVYVRIILPQAITVAIPHYCVDFIGVVHNTSLAFILGIMDMMGRAKSLGAATGFTLEGYLVVTVIYIIISLFLKFVFYIVERKLQFGRRGYDAI